MELHRAGYADSSDRSHVSAPAAAHLRELYAACCIYVGDRAGEVMLRELLPFLVAYPPGTERVELHRLTYRAAVEHAPVRTGDRDGADVRHAMAALPLASRAAVFLVDAAGMRYAEVADVLGAGAGDISELVASGRRRLRSLVWDGSG